jgi:hypothetical protein
MAMRSLDLIPRRWLEYEPPSDCHDFGIGETLAAILASAGVDAGAAGAIAPVVVGGAEGAGLGAATSAITGGDPLMGALTGGVGGGALAGVGELAGAAPVGEISPVASSGGNLSAVGAPSQIASAAPDVMLGNSATLGGDSPISSGAAFESATLPGYMPVSATSETGNLVAGGASQNIIGDAAQAAGGSLGSTTSDLGLGVTPTSAGAPSAATAAPVSTSAPATGATAPVSGATAPVSSDVVADTNLAGGDYGGGGDKPASFIDKALKYVENNPLSVAGAGITGLQMLMGNGTPPAQKQLTAMAGENMHNAQAMEAYLTAGKLPAGMQMGVDRALKGQERRSNPTCPGWASRAPQWKRKPLPGRRNPRKSKPLRSRWGCSSKASTCPVLRRVNGRRSCGLNWRRIKLFRRRSEGLPAGSPGRGAIRHRRRRKWISDGVAIMADLTFTRIDEPASDTKPDAPVTFTKIDPAPTADEVGPWTKYQKGPWTKYQKAPPVSQGDDMGGFVRIGPVKVPQSDDMGGFVRIEPPSFGERVWQGVTDPFYGGAQIGAAIGAATDYGFGPEMPPAQAKQVDQSVRAREREYEIRRGPDAGFDWGRLLGNVLSPQNVALTAAAPASAASLPARIGAGMLGGALGAASEPVTHGDVASGKIGQVVTGAALGAL